MADTSGMADIRGIDIDKAAKGYAEQQLILKRYLTVSPTSAREIRWYKKTEGFLDSTDTTAITASQIANVAQLTRPDVVEQSWTRQTSYVRKYFVESPTISMEDIRDSDVDVLMTNMRDLVRAVGYQVESRIYSVLTEGLSPSNINTAAAAGTGWDDTTNGDIVGDLMTAKQNIITYNYNPEDAILLINPIEYKNLVKFIINVKGANIPGFSSQVVQDGEAMRVLGLRVVVSNVATTDYALVFVPKQAATWKSFMEITGRSIEDVGIGTKIRVWEEGECLLTDPKAVHLITDTVT